MSKDEILASLAVLALAGAIIYVYNANEAKLAANAITNTSAMDADLNAIGNNMEYYNEGPNIYVANTPYLFQVPLGSIVPPLTAPNDGSVSSATVNGTTANQSQCLGCVGA